MTTDFENHVPSTKLTRLTHVLPPCLPFPIHLHLLRSRLAAAKERGSGLQSKVKINICIRDG